MTAYEKSKINSEEQNLFIKNQFSNRLSQAYESNSINSLTETLTEMSNVNFVYSGSMFL